MPLSAAATEKPSSGATASRSISKRGRFAPSRSMRPTSSWRPDSRTAIASWFAVQSSSTRSGKGKAPPVFNRLVSASLRHRLIVLAVALGLICYGAFVLPRIPVDVFPDLDRPVVALMTEAGGLAPQEVEQLVTFPI